jgi:hypothetical protein
MKFGQTTAEVGQMPVEQVLLRLGRLGQRPQQRRLPGIRHAKQNNAQTIAART